MAYFWW